MEDAHDPGYESNLDNSANQRVVAGETAWRFVPVLPFQAVLLDTVPDCECF